jgi:hypothetical protein
MLMTARLVELLGAEAQTGPEVWATRDVGAVAEDKMGAVSRIGEPRFGTMVICMSHAPELASQDQFFQQIFSNYMISKRD